MVSKLELYNMALGHLGPVRLASLTENRADRREIDAVYTQAIDHILENGVWAFALRSQKIEPDTDFDPLFGRTYAYTLPDDFVRLRRICTDERMTQEDETYFREGDQVFSDQSVLYVTFVSDDTNYGYNLGKWSQMFAEAVAAEIAYKSGLPITKDRGTKNDLEVIKKRKLLDAKRIDALDEPVKFKPQGSWVRSRGPGRVNQRRSPLSSDT